MNLRERIEAQLNRARELVKDAKRQLENIDARPPGCACNPEAWNKPGSIPPVCSKFVTHPGWPGGACTTCEHLKECHNLATEGGEDG